MFYLFFGLLSIIIVSTFYSSSLKGMKEMTSVSIYPTQCQKCANITLNLSETKCYYFIHLFMALKMYVGLFVWFVLAGVFVSLLTFELLCLPCQTFTAANAPLYLAK